MRRFPHVFFFLLSLLVCLSAFGEGETQPPRKVVIFYSSIGAGHISSARAIEARVRAENPSAVVELKNIRDFMPPWRERLDERLFWFVVKNYPSVFTSAYLSTMEAGNRARSLEANGTSYDSTALREYLEQVRPDAILSTHYGAAAALGILREQGHFRNVPMGWLHTDYIEGFFPRISNAVDMSFLPHPDLTRIWANAGVDPSRVAVTGMPLNSKLFEPGDREKFLRSQGLDPNIRTITLASGAEGVGDFPLIVRQLAAMGNTPLQIVAVTANNKAHFDALTKLKQSLPSHVTLLVKGMVPQEELLNFIKASDLYITKAGGLSPTEGFAIGRPMVVLDVYGGHEAENARFFENLGLAVVNRNQADIGRDVMRVLGNPELQARMREAQQRFRNSLNLDAVVDFALRGRSSLETAPVNFGVENGMMARRSEQALHHLDRDSPADVEILLSYPIGTRARGAYDLNGGSNPFGHIALRIGNTVYSVSAGSKVGEDQHLLLPVTLQQYLYGTTRPSPNARYGSDFGIAYSRDTIGLRLSGVPPDRLRAMVEEIGKIDKEWREGAVCYDFRRSNCGNFTERVLERLGLEGSGRRTDLPLPAMPLDIFQRAMAALDSRPDLGAELVAYTRVPDSQSPYTEQRFPVAITQPLRALGHLLGWGNDNLVRQASRRITGYPGDLGLHYENVDRTSHETAVHTAGANRAAAEERARLLREQEVRLRALHAENVRRGFTAEAIARRLSEQVTSPTEEGREFIAQADAALKELHAQYDLFNLAKTDHLMKTYRDLVADTLALLERNLTPAQKSGLAELAERIERHYAGYRERRPLYGQPKDVQRIDSIRDFFWDVQAFQTELDRVMNPSNQPSFFAGLRRRFSTLASQVAQLPTLLPPLLRVFGRLARQGGSSPRGQTPLTQDVFAGFRALGEARGVHVTVHGRENIPVKASPKVVNLFAIQHANPILDNVAMSHLNLPNAVIFGAADSFGMGQWVANRFDRSNQFVVVGRGSNRPIQRALEILREGTTRDLVVYPEGSVSAGIYETRAPREKFSWGLVNALRSAGYEVNVIPVSLPDNYRYNDNWTNPIEPGAGNLSVHIHPAIGPAMLDRMLGPPQPHGERVSSPVQPALAEAVGMRAPAPLPHAGLGVDDQILNRLLRQTWLDTMPTDDAHLMGMPSVDTLLERARQFVEQNVPNPPRRQCKEMYTWLPLLGGL